MKVFKRISLLFLFLFSLSFGGYKYYYIFTSNSNKSLSGRFETLEKNISKQNVLSEIGYDKLKSLGKTKILNNVKIGLVNNKDLFFKIGSQKYFFGDFNLKYPGVIKDLNYGDLISIEYVSFNGIYYIINFSYSVDLDVGKKYDYYLIGKIAILTVNQLLSEDKVIQIEYLKDTVFRNKDNNKMLKGDEKSILINQFNSGDNKYQIFKIQGIYKNGIFYCSEVLYGHLYNDEKTKYNFIKNQYAKLVQKQEENTLKIKKLSQRGNEVELNLLFENLGLEYNTVKSIFSNLATVEKYYKAKKEEVLINYRKLFGIQG